MIHLAYTFIVIYLLEIGRVMKEQQMYDKLYEEHENLKQQLRKKKKIIRDLRKSEIKFHTILDTIKEGFFELDLSGSFTFVNDAEAKMLGYSKEELMGMNYRKYTSGQAAKALRDVFIRMYQTSEPALLQDYEIIMKDGTRCIHELSATLIRNSSGRPVGFQGLSRDITKRKHIEQTLRESEERYRFIAENMNDVVWMADMDLRIKYVSPCIEKVTGFSPDEFMHKRLHELLTPGSFTHALDIMKQELEHENDEDCDPSRTVTIELEHLKKDGSTVWVELLIGAIRDDTGRLTGIHGVSRDINERRKYELEREHLVERLQDALAHVKTLSGLLPICANCKKIRDDKGYWNQLESYISDHSEAVFTHGICPECSKMLYPDYNIDT